MSPKGETDYQKNVKKYPYVYAWGRLMGSFHYYIEQQLEAAVKDKAPENAIYKKDDGTWATTEGLIKSAMFNLDNYVREIKI